MDLDSGDSPWGDVPSQSDAADDNAVESPPDGDRSSSPLTVNDSANQASQSTTSIKSPSARTMPARKIPARKIEVQPTRLEDATGSLDPLGPLGAEEPSTTHPSEQGPNPRQKETNVAMSRALPARPSQSPSSPGFLDANEQQDFSGFLKRTKGAPPIQAAGPGAQRLVQASVGVEQVAKPSFEITVGDPHKVGDLATSHIVYQVRTKTTSTAYRQPDFAVSRRYRDFLWLYNSLHNNNPGIVVPPPPEKQAVGRFDTSFVESRRQALERMLNKTASHPVLQYDPDLKIFLESDSFSLDVKNKENREPDLGQNKGMFGSFGINVGGSGSKFVEHDDWFHDRKIYLDALEIQLKALLKALDIVVSQRKVLAEAAGDFASSLGSLAAVELSPTLSGPLAGLSEVQLRVRELYERQAQQDILTLGITIDEYMRLISSIKQAFQQRQKAYHTWHNSESELQKRRSTQEKLLRQGKSQQDKLNEVGAGVADAERKAHSARLLFEDMGRLMRGELERFEREKVEDFKSGVETFLEGAVEAQKELIELWETFLLQLDTEESDDVVSKPAPLPPSAELPKEEATVKPAENEGRPVEISATTVEQDA